jgi:hypothetical protein
MAAVVGRSTRSLAVIAMRRTIIWAVFGAAMFAAEAGDPPSFKITGTFSNLTYSKRGGDMVGSEIFILSATGATFAMIQCGAGRLGAPILVPIMINPPHIRFTVPSENDANCPSGEVRATISARGLSGKSDASDWPGFLPRRKSYWQ